MTVCFLRVKKKDCFNNPLTSLHYLILPPPKKNVTKLLPPKYSLISNKTNGVIFFKITPPTNYPIQVSPKPLSKNILPKDLSLWECWKKSINWQQHSCFFAYLYKFEHALCMCVNRPTRRGSCDVYLVKITEPPAHRNADAVRDVTCTM